jgi:HEAT repeat protein
LNRAGYKQEVIPFFRNCIRAYPYEVLREKCVVGLVAADPAAAFETLTVLEKEPGEVKSTALRLMGLLASQPRLPKGQKDALVETLIARTQGLQSTSHSLAAIHGLALAGDARAVEPLRKMTKGMATPEVVERAAKRALLITFKDVEIVPTLEKNARGGFGSNDDDKLFAAALLIEAGHDSGYAWAKEQLTKKKGGLSRFKKGGPDILDEIVWVLANRGGKKSIPALQAALPIRKPTEWLSAYIAVSLLDLGDRSGMEVAKMALSNDRWLTTRLEAVEAIAAHGDLSGLSVLEQLSADKSAFKKASDLSLGKFRSADAVKEAVASSIADMDVPEGVDLLLALLRDDSDEVRTAAAYAFGRMKTPRAVEGLAAGLTVDYGKDGARPRSPEVKAHLLRTALRRFPRHAATKQMVESAGSSEFLSVRFLALAAGRTA